MFDSILKAKAGLEVAGLIVRACAPGEILHHMSVEVRAIGIRGTMVAVVVGDDGVDCSGGGVRVHREEQAAEPVVVDTAADVGMGRDVNELAGAGFSVDVSREVGVE